MQGVIALARQISYRRSNVAAGTPLAKALAKREDGARTVTDPNFSVQSRFI